MKECYDVKTVPVIHNVSSNTGYITGGQNLTVYGFGFDYGLINAKVDGLDCKVTAQSKTSFQCTTSAASAVSVSQPQAGQHGVRRKYINGTTYLNRDVIPATQG